MRSLAFCDVLMDYLSMKITLILIFPIVFYNVLIDKYIINKINLYSAKSSLTIIQGALHVHDIMFLKLITQMYN